MFVEENICELDFFCFYGKLNLRSSFKRKEK